MLLLAALLLALLPAAAIAYPFLVGRGDDDLPPEDDEGRETALALRWDAALSGLKSAELDWSIERLDEEGYRRLREAYMGEAALVMKEMDLEEEQERLMLESMAADEGADDRAPGGSGEAAPPRDVEEGGAGRE